MSMTDFPAVRILIGAPELASLLGLKGAITATRWAAKHALHPVTLEAGRPSYCFEEALEVVYRLRANRRGFRRFGEVNDRSVDKNSGIQLLITTPKLTCEKDQAEEGTDDFELPRAKPARKAARAPVRAKSAPSLSPARLALAESRARERREIVQWIFRGRDSLTTAEFRAAYQTLVPVADQATDLFRGRVLREKLIREIGKATYALV